MAGRHCNRNRKLREHIFKYKLETESKLEAGQAQIFSKPPPPVNDVLSPARLYHLSLPPDSVTNWEPSVQILKSIRIILIQTTTWMHGWFMDG